MKGEKKEVPLSLDPARGHVGGGAQETATWKWQRERCRAWHVALPGCLASAVYRVTFLPSNKKEFGTIAALPAGMSQHGRPTVCSQLTLREELEVPTVCRLTLSGAAEEDSSPAPGSKSAPTLIVRQLGLWHTIVLLRACN